MEHVWVDRDAVSSYYRIYFVALATILHASAHRLCPATKLHPYVRDRFRRREPHETQTKKRATPDIYFAPSDLEEEKRREKRTFQVNG